MQQSLPLSLPDAPPEPTPARMPQQEAPRQRAALWAAIFLPAFALEALGVSATSDRAIAVVESRAPRASLLAVTAGARQLGIKAGMTAAAACARAASLQLRQRDGAREVQALERLASWGKRFTPIISTEPPHAVLMEVGGSLKLFGGIKTLQECIQVELEAQGYTAQLAVAPTPRAALWLARAGHKVVEHEPERIPGTLGALPVSALALSQRSARSFDRLGIKTLRQAFRLPRDGLAKRFGPELLRDWDRALGQMPEPRRHWQAAPRFAAERELPAACADLALLEPVIDELITALAASLRCHNAGIDAFALQFRHEDQASTRLALQLLSASCDGARLKRLAATRLERFELPAPVISIRLTSNVFQTLVPDVPALFEQPTQSSKPDTLVETLRARLGRRAVVGLAPLADPRPEKAWRIVEPGAPKTTSARDPQVPAAPRPFWLLPAPQPLSIWNGKPLYAGRVVRLEDSPERIEGGWWTGGDIGRDYYRAHADDGAKLWIFREHRGARGWFLHGYFA